MNKELEKLLFNPVRLKILSFLFYPLTLCKITSKGKTSFKFFLNSLQSYGINESADVDFKK